MGGAAFGGLVAIAASRTRARFGPPRTARDFLERPRLDATMARGIDAGVLLVSAPAGYGKTSVVSTWLGAAGLRTAWLSLTASHRDPLTLLADTIEALAQLEPRVADLRAQLRAGEGPHAVADQRRALVEALDLAEDFAVLVIDDVHALAGADAALAVLEQLAHDAPSALALVLLARERPAFPSLARAVASAQFATIDADALAFQPDEADALLESLGTPEAARPSIIERAQGWPLAISLLGRRTVEAASTSGSRVNTTDLDEFVRTEVFDPLPQETRALLQACAVPAYFDGEIANEVTQRGDAAAVIDRFHVRTGLLTQVGDGRWLRMHPLVREHCLRRLTIEDPARLAAYRARAARALAREGELEEATELALDAEAWSQARELIVAQVEPLNGRGAWALLAGWLDRLPSDQLAEAPDLALLQARVAIWLMRLAEAHQLLDRLESQLSDPRDRALALLYRGVAFRQARRLDDALRVQRGARALIEENEPEDSPLRVEADVEEGTVLGMRGDLGPSIVMLERAALGAQSLGHTRFGARAYGNLGMALQFDGKLAAASEAFRESRRRWEHLGEGNELLRNLNNEATSAHILGNVDDAEVAFQRIAVETAGLGRFGAFASLGLADVARDRGDLKRAQELYHEATERGLALDLGAVVTAAAFGLGMVLLEQGDVVRARREFEHHLRVTAQQRAAEFASRFRLGLARAQLCEGRNLSAIGAIQDILDDSGGAFQRRQQLLLMRAAAEFRTGKLLQMTATLEELHALIEELGFDQFLIAEARLCTDMLADEVVAGIANGYFPRLLERAGLQFSQPRGLPPEPSVSSVRSASQDVELIIRAFGAPTVTRPGDEALDLPWRSERSRELLLFMLTRSGPVTREEVLAALWPETPVSQLSSLFHNNVHRLRRTVGDHVILRARGGYSMNPGVRIDFDVRRFEALLAEAEEASAAGRTAERSAALRAAVALHTGPFARSIESEWAEELRARLDDHFVGAALTLARLDIADNEFSEAVSLAERVLELDPLNEEAVRHLIAAHVGAGFPDLALRAYRRLQRLTERDLGVPPSAETRDALERGLAGSTLLG